MIVRSVELAYPRHVSEEVDLLAEALSGAAHVFVFLDYSGTLVPNARERDVRPHPDVLRKLAQLASVQSFSVFVMGEQTVRELKDMVGIAGVGYIGQRGCEICEVGGPTFYPVGPEDLDTLVRRLELEVHRRLDSYPGVRVENRGFALAVHYGDLAAHAADGLSGIVADLVRRLDLQGRLEILYGDGVIEVCLSGWHKGDAVGYILGRAAAEESLAIYLGDDVTDEEAFETVDSWSENSPGGSPWFMPSDEEDDVTRSLTILVAGEPRPTAAMLFVRSPQEVYEFLSSLAAIASTLL